MEDESTGPSAKQRNSGETDKNDESKVMMMSLILHLLQWKLRLNLKF